MTSLKSRVGVAPDELDTDDNVTVASISVERAGEPDQELQYQELYLTPAELRAVYDRLKIYFEQGIWSVGSVER